VSDGRRRRLARRILAPALLFAVAACASLLGGPAPHLYRVTAVSAFPPDLPHVSAQLLVDVPQAPAGLDARRIALSRSPVSLDYFADSEWTDRIAILIQTALVYSFENSQAITAVGPGSMGLRADFTLQSEVRHFVADYRAAGGTPIVSVAIVVKLVKMPAGEIVADAAFAAQQPAAANDVPYIVTAFDAALGKVLEKIVVWTLTNPALSTRRG
jgi:cholesterol transport system auxiliary component